MSATAIAARVRDELRRSRLAVELLLERRWLAVVIADVVLLLQALVAALTSNGEPATIYAWVVQGPQLLLGVPVLANGVALERRAGSLESLLASPAGASVLLRRYASFAGLILLQSAVVLLGAWLFPARRFPLPFVLLQTTLACATLAAVTLFWCLHLRGVGASILASLLTLLALAPWFLDNPIPPADTPSGHLLIAAVELPHWLMTNLVLALVSAIFLLYSHSRLSNPEKLLL